jgi:GNAT superfamily N-acetyltransferase
MRIVDEHGLAIALVSPEELADTPWTTAGAPVDLVRVTDPPPSYWDRLASLGFIRKPNTLTWLSRLGPDEDGYLAGLSRKPRQLVRRAQRAAEILRTEVEDRVHESTVDRFLALYEDRVAQLRYGVAYGTRHRDAVLDGPPKYFGVFCYEGDELAGGCLVQECPPEDAIRVRFSAVTEPWRKASLSRVLYFRAMQVAREKGYTYATLGDEWNLYGHMTQPGLFTFKADLGFAPVASQDFADPDGNDEADLVLGLGKLADPTMVLGYAESEDRLHAHLFSNEIVDVDRYHAPFLAGVTVHRPGTR